MPSRRSFFSFALLASLSAVAACAAEPEGSSSASPREDDVVGGTNACIAGTSLRFPSFEEDAPVVAHVSATHRSGGESLGVDLVVSLEANPVTVLAAGAGDHAGNFQYVSREDVRVCGGRIEIAAGAHVDLSGEGLGRDGLERCAADLGRPECATLAYYCAPGSLDLGGEGRATRCALREGVAVEATVHRAIGGACTPGGAYRSPGFDEDVETTAEAVKPHDAHGYELLAGVPAPSAGYLTVGAKGTGPLAGNWQVLARDAYRVCDGRVFVEPRAEIEFFGGGLTEAELAACARDASAARCETIAHYCEPGTTTLRGAAPLRCRLREGAPVEATVTRAR